MRLGTESVVALAFFVADGKTSDPVRAHPVVLVAFANIRFDTCAVNAAVRAYRLALCAFCAFHDLVSHIALACIWSYAGSLFTRRRTIWHAEQAGFPIALAALLFYRVYSMIL